MYNNRDISWLGFNHRVLMEADNPQVPLMERVLFLSIFSSNLDEFFRVRFPLIAVYSKLNKKERHKIVPPPEIDLAEKVQSIMDVQLADFGRIINTGLLPLLEEHNIVLYYKKPIPDVFNNELKEVFFSKILSFIQPVFITKSLSEDFFPESNRQYFLVSLLREGHNLKTHAFVNIPSQKLGRFHSIITPDGVQHIFFIDDIIRQNLPFLFSSYQIASSYSFKITRDADLKLDEENYKQDILGEIERKLAKREKGTPCRLLYEAGMPLALQQFMANSFGLTDKQLFEGDQYHNLADLADLPVTREGLSYPTFSPLKHKQVVDPADIFNRLETTDLLFHFPYHSYNPILSFFNQAAIDPDVKSIYATLYRVADDSHIVNALISAAKNKKKVVVFVELKARFDEANNIRWSKEMEKAGATIVYSLSNIKVHAKVALVNSKKASGKISYALIGTGNFNENTARFYTDHVLLTTSRSITDDVRTLFSALAKGIESQKRIDKSFNHLLVTKNNMVEEFEKAIEKQIQRHKQGMPASIRIKVNNLEDVGMIDLLYKASNARVPVKLIVRSVCCIKTGKDAPAKNVQVKRIVDRFLEHTRIFIFGEDDDLKVYIGSCDWMTRNLYKRIEVGVPILDKGIARELVDYFELQWADEVKGVLLDEVVDQCRPRNDVQQIESAQQKIYSYLSSRYEIT